MRTRGGMMIHHESCHMAQRGLAAPWGWADAVTSPRDLRIAYEAMSNRGVRQCARCRPMDAIFRREGAR